MIVCYEHARVYTGCGNFADCFAVEDGLFVYVGTSAQAHQMYPDAEFIDLNGQFVCPGFNDSHMHLLGTGCMLARAQLAPHTTSLQSVLDEISAFAAAHPDEAWILGRGWNHDYFTDACRYPTREDLDAVCPDKPCLITRACGHVAAANSRALELAGIASRAVDVEGGRVATDASGRPNGILEENAISLVSMHIPKPDRNWIKQRLLDAMAYVNSFGITSVHSDDFSSLDIPYHEVLAAYEELIAEGRMTVRVYEQCLLPTEKELEKFLADGHLTGKGDHQFRIGPLKILTDGSLGARTAFLRAPYADNADTCGIPTYEQSQLESLILSAHRAGMQIAAHAIGDAAADRVLTAVEKAQAEYLRDNTRHGIVHAQVFTHEQASRAAALGMHAYIQPIFLDYDTQIVYERLGSRADDAYPAASLMQAGMSLSGGSDSPVEPPDVLEGIQCAVTRQPVTRAQEHPYLPKEALTCAQAIDLFTSCSAYASFDEEIKGKIAEGYLADFTVLGSNPFDTHPAQIHVIPVRAVYLGGKQVFKA